tara:strand:+ start:485 stop:670 length:186 start_codon:yes stop_codon:yes gene_type:complete
MSTKTNTSNTSLDLIKSIQDTSRTANLYGKLLELKDMKLHIINRIIDIEKQIAEGQDVKSK